MKQWVVILLLGVLATEVPGCDRAPRYDGRLTAADSLMRDNPDSALTQMRGCLVFEDNKYNKYKLFH